MTRRLIATIFVSGALAGVMVEAALAASATKKKCGDAATGGTNGECVPCIGNCAFVQSKYKTCTGTGTTCEDTVDTQCSGVLWNGGGDGQGCDGKVIMDGTGVQPITCQNNPFKTCT